VKLEVNHRQDTIEAEFEVLDLHLRYVDFGNTGGLRQVFFGFDQEVSEDRDDV
jgi:hypothetical protein